MHFIILGHTTNLISCISIITYFRMITLQGTIFWTTSSNKELAHRWLPYLARSYISLEEVFSSLNNSDSRPFNFLFQIARGSGATVSECTFSSKKHTSLSKKHTPPENPKKRYMVSLKKALGRCLFLLGKT